LSASFNLIIINVNMRVSFIWLDRRRANGYRSGQRMTRNREKVINFDIRIRATGFQPIMAATLSKAFGPVL